MINASTPARLLSDGIELAVRVTPRASRTLLAGLTRDAQGQTWLQVRLAAPPVEGAANAALLRFLAELFDVPASACRLVAGASARNKRVHISGDPAQLRARLAPLLAGASP